MITKEQLQELKRKQIENYMTQQSITIEDKENKKIYVYTYNIAEKVFKKLTISNKEPVLEIL